MDTSTSSSSSSKVYKTSTGVILENELLLHEAVITNDAETVRRLIEEDAGALNVDCRNNYGRTPIHLAASRGNTDIVDMLISAKCDIEAKDKFGMRPVHMAACYGHRDAVDSLLRAGATVTAVDKKQRNLLMLASRSSSSSSFLEYVIDKLEPNAAAEARAQDCEGASALHHAARAGHAEAIDALARMAPDLDFDLKDQNGQTALHYACSGGQHDAASRLLDLGASLHLRDHEDCTPLHLAARNQESRLCGILLNRCTPDELARLLRFTDRQDFTLLHVAASLGCTLMLGMLLELEGPRMMEALEGRCKDGNTPLHLAAGNNQPQAVDVLLEHGAALDSLNDAMLTPLQLATAAGHKQVIRMLQTAGAGATDSSDAEQEHQQHHHPQQQQEDNSDEATAALRVAAKTSLASIANMIARTARLDYPALFIQGTRALFSPDK